MQIVSLKIIEFGCKSKIIKAVDKIDFRCLFAKKLHILLYTPAFHDRMYFYYYFFKKALMKTLFIIDFPQKKIFRIDFRKKIVFLPAVKK
jgi:hypothetical protein